MVHDSQAHRPTRLTLSRAGVCERLGIHDTTLLKGFPKLRHGHYSATFVDLVVKIMRESGLKARPATKVAIAIDEGRIP